MVKPVAIPNVFATGNGGNVPVSLLDADFTALASAVNDLSTYSNFVADTGAANSYALTFPTGIATPLVKSLEVVLAPTYTNTGPSTLSLNGGAPVPILYQDGSPLVAAALQAGSVYKLLYNGTNWQTYKYTNQYTTGSPLLQIVTSIAGLRTVLKTSNPTALATGYYSAGDGGHGLFYYVAGDTTSTDNGFTIIVAADGGRWYLAHNGVLSVKQAGAHGDNVNNDTAAIQTAITVCAAGKFKLRVPSGTYSITPNNAQTSAEGTNTSAFIMASNMWIEGDPGAAFRIANSVSTDAAPLRMSMFFSNTPLSNIMFDNLVMDMNAANNTISPQRGSLIYNRFTQAAIIFSGGGSGNAAAGATDVTVQRCTIQNCPGVSCIVMSQSNTSGITLGTRWKLLYNIFTNVGTDTDDHSSVFGWATDVIVEGNYFTNPNPWSNTTKTGGLCAYEMHGSNQKFYGNSIVNYYQGLWLAQNYTEPVVKNLHVFGNKATVVQVFTDFFSGNGTTGAIPDSLIQDVEVWGNEIELTNDPSPNTVKAFFQFSARQQPAVVRIHNNVCRSFATTLNSVLALPAVSPNQLNAGDQIYFVDNTASGIVAGVVFFFNGNGAGAAANFGTVTVENNRLGTLVPSPGGLYQNKDVFLYGVSAGLVSALRVYGLEQSSPIYSDGFAGGRATVFGKAVLNLAVTWSGITALGNGTTTSKVSLDSDAGHLNVSLQLAAGSTTTASGPIYPLIAGVAASTNGAASGLQLVGSTPTALMGKIDAGGSYIALWTTSTQYTAASFTTTSIVNVGGVFPCNSASV